MLFLLCNQLSSVHGRPCLSSSTPSSLHLLTLPPFHTGFLFHTRVPLEFGSRTVEPTWWWRAPTTDGRGLPSSPYAHVRVWLALYLYKSISGSFAIFCIFCAFCAWCKINFWLAEHVYIYVVLIHLIFVLYAILLTIIKTLYCYCFCQYGCSCYSYYCFL